MNDSFAFNDTFSTSDDHMEDLFPPLNEDGQVTFDALAIANHDNNNTRAQHKIDSREDELMQTRQESSSSELLWHDVDNLSIPDFKSGNSSSNNNNNKASSSATTTVNCSGDNNNNNNTATGLMMPNDNDTGISNTLATVAVNDSIEAEASAVFNISWGGNDKPPAELHLEQPEESEMVSRRPLPKPRGVKRLPEPEPAEDGTLDEDTLRRRRNTYAARRSRMKKFLKIEYLENRVNQLQTENAKLVLSNALLESEKRGWMAKEAEYKKRIKLLECSSGASSASGTPPADIQEQQSMDTK